MFDAFLFAVEGKKLRPRKSQTFFEDRLSNWDYGTANVGTAALNNSLETASIASADNIASSNDSSKLDVEEKVPRNCQSLTAFLQKSQLFRNNTELEKENAHFLVSEAIISAIEHIKWAKTEPDKWKSKQTLNFIIV